MKLNREESRPRRPGGAWLGVERHPGSGLTADSALVLYGWTLIRRPTSTVRGLTVPGDHDSALL
jgi:hypothetical protein